MSGRSAATDAAATISPFENSLSRSVHPCTLLDANFYFVKTSLLCGTTDIPVRDDTLRIFSSGMDAAGLNRSDISASPKFAIKSVHGCTLLMMQRRRRYAYLCRKPFEIDDTDARSVQKTPAGVLFVRRGLFFVKRQRRCAVYFQKVVIRERYSLAARYNCES